MRRFVLTLLFLAVIVSLGRDETTALLSLSNEHLTKAEVEEVIDPRLSHESLTRAEVEEIIDKYLSARTWIRCDCQTPTVECEEVCAQSDQVGMICGTMVLQAEMEIRRAMEVGSTSTRLSWKIRAGASRRCMRVWRQLGTGHRTKSL